jgi:hypothetical protein
VFPKKEGGEEGEDKEKEREEKEGGGEEEYGKTRTMVSQDDVNLKAIDCNEDNSNRSDNDGQSNNGNNNTSSSQKRRQQQSKDAGREASRTHADKYWNWLPNSATPAMNKEMTVLEMKQVSLSLLQPTMMHDRQSSAELFDVASGSGARPLSHHACRLSGHSLIDGHVDEPLPVSNNSGGGNGRE